jgi:hypothetical protein
MAYVSDTAGQSWPIKSRPAQTDTDTLAKVMYSGSPSGVGACG